MIAVSYRTKTNPDRVETNSKYGAFFKLIAAASDTNDDRKLRDIRTSAND